MESIGLYLHIPFCAQKCAYCDFNSYAGLEALFEPYASALSREIERSGPARVRTVYIGGGTPTVLPVSFIGSLLAAVWATFDVEPGAEVSLEANPGTVDGKRLSALGGLGVNRLSLGVQSLVDEELRLLGRIHTAAQAVAALQAARDAGLDNVNLDLIYGLPGQTLASWRSSLDQALDLAPDHLSLYALTVEEGTLLAAEIEAGRLAVPDPDLAADMYDLAQERLAAEGFVHYEISNWAWRPGMECMHNLTYWRNEPYLGLGAGAHSWLGGRRWANITSPADYIHLVQAGERPVESEEAIGPELEMGETMMMGLRLLHEGVAFDRFERRFGRDLRRQYGAELAELSALELIAVHPDRVTLSNRGRLLANQVFMRFLPDS